VEVAGVVDEAGSKSSVARFEQVEVSHPAIERLLAELRAAHVNGGALLACFAVSGGDTPRLHWFMSAEPSGFSAHFDRFLTSLAVARALPELEMGKTLRAEPNFQHIDSFTLDGELAHVLVAGGAYRKFPGAPNEARDVTRAFCDAVFGDRYREVWVYRSRKAWSAWFYDVAWDATWVIADVGTSRVWLLCVTDTD
jgi:hypothetical protein